MTQTTGNGHGPGKPGDFGSGFVDAVAAAIRHDSTDEQVPIAVGVGWYMAAMSYPGDVTKTAAAARGDLSGLGALTEGDVFDFCKSQVEVGFVKLKDMVTAAGLELPPIAMPLDRTKAEDLSSKALGVLTAADFRLGKAYGVGRALMNLTTRPAPGATLADQFTWAKVAPVLAAIDDLSSALRPHAGHSVRFSVKEWLLSVEGKSAVAPEGDATWSQLARQGELWRALLSGEKSGMDMLEIEDYLDAADRLSRRIRTIAFRLLARFWYVAALIVFLVAAGIVIIIVTDTAASILAGAGTILAGLGLTWRAAGRSVGGLSGKLEEPLWGAELDNAITRAITLLPPESGRDVALHRRQVAVALGGG